MKSLQRSVIAGLVLLCAGCDQSSSTQRPVPVTEVGVTTLHTQPVDINSDLTGRVTGTMVSQVIPQVGGIIQKRLFTEGDDVKAGQVLYQIDPASYQAAYDQAIAELKYAQAVVRSSKLKAQRYAALVKENGVSKQDNDDAQATYLQNVASVEQYRAAVESARINLNYTRVTAPISGRIGISSVTPGALVTASQSTALATIRTLDPIYVDLTQSSMQLLKLRRQQASLKQDTDTVPVTLTLEDGTTYNLQGKLELTEIAVDESTGSVTMRAIFANPQHVLLPGMYVRASVTNGVKTDAILAPQQGITRNAKGDATALIVDAENKVESRSVVADRVIGNKWLINSGLKDGDQLIVQGTAKVQAGMTVKPVEVKPDADSATSGGN